MFYLQKELQKLIEKKDFSGISDLFSIYKEKYDELSLKYEIEKSKNDLFEKTHDFTQKESDNMKKTLVDLAVRLDKEAESLTTRRLDLDQEIETKTRLKIAEIESFYIEKQKKLIEMLSDTDEKAGKQEEFTLILEKKLDLLLKGKSQIKSLIIEEDARNEKKKEFEERIKGLETRVMELKDEVSDLKRKEEALIIEKTGFKNELETLKNEKKQLLGEKKQFKEKILALEENVAHKETLFESFQQEIVLQIQTLHRESALEKEELLSKIRKYEKNEDFLRKKPSQSQGFSPLPKEFESKFDSHLDFRLEALSTPKYGVSMHEFEKKGDSGNSCNVLENEKMGEILKENQIIREEITKSREELSFCKRTIENLRTAKIELQRQFEQLIHDQTNFRRENNQKDSKILDFQREIEGCKQKIQEKEGKIKDLAEKIQIFEKTLKEKDGIIKESLESLNKYKEKVRVLTSNEVILQEKETLLKRIQTENEEIKGKVQLLERQKASLLQKTSELLQKNDGLVRKNSELLKKEAELSRKEEEINQKNKEIFFLQQSMKTHGNRKVGSSAAIFIDDPNIKDIEIEDLKTTLRQKQQEIDHLKEKGSNQTNSAPTLLLRALEKKDNELKQIRKKNAELCLNLQSASEKIKELMEKPHVMQNTTTNVIVNNTRGKSDGLVFDRNWQKLLGENEKMRKEIPRLEQLLLKSRLNAVEERASLQNELKGLEEKNIELKVKLAQMAFDKDYFKIKYEEILKDMHRKL